MAGLRNDPTLGQNWPTADGPAGGPHDGEQPDVTDEYPIGGRAGRDPANLGNDVPDEGDLVYPPPEPVETPSL